MDIKRIKSYLIVDGEDDEENKEILISTIILIGFVVYVLFSIIKYSNIDTELTKTMFGTIQITQNEVFTTFILFYTWMRNMEKVILEQKIVTK